MGEARNGRGGRTVQFGAKTMVPTPPTVDLTALLGFARYAVIAYAAGATILTTACLALQALTHLDRRTLSRTVRRERPLLVPLDTAPEGA